MKKIACLLGAAVLGLGAVAAFGQQGRIGPFTAQQMNDGRTAYGANCAMCHQANMSGGNDALPLAGKAFMGAWSKRTTADLYNKIHTSMPLGRGTSPAEICDAVKFILAAPAMTGQMIALDGGQHLGWGQVPPGGSPED